MINQVTFRRAIFIGLLALLAAIASTLLISPKTEAISCGGAAASAHSEWLVTASAQARTDSGLYCSALKPTCRQECLVGCGSTTPLENYACFAN